MYTCNIHVHMYVHMYFFFFFFFFFVLVRDTLLQKHISEPQGWPTCELKIMSIAFEKIKIAGSFLTFIFNFIQTGGYETF